MITDFRCFSKFLFSAIVLSLSGCGPRENKSVAVELIGGATCTVKSALNPEVSAVFTQAKVNKIDPVSKAELPYLSMQSLSCDSTGLSTIAMTADVFGDCAGDDLKASALIESLCISAYLAKHVGHAGGVTKVEQLENDQCRVEALEIGSLSFASTADPSAGGHKNFDRISSLICLKKSATPVVAGSLAPKSMIQIKFHLTRAKPQEKSDDEADVESVSELEQERRDKEEVEKEKLKQEQAEAAADKAEAQPDTPDTPDTPETPEAIEAAAVEGAAPVGVDRTGLIDRVSLVRPVRDVSSVGQMKSCKSLHPFDLMTIHDAVRAFCREGVTKEDSRRIAESFWLTLDLN